MVACLGFFNLLNAFYVFLRIPQASQILCKISLASIILIENRRSSLLQRAALENSLFLHSVQLLNTNLPRLSYAPLWYKNFNVHYVSVTKYKSASNGPNLPLQSNLHEKKLSLHNRDKLLTRELQSGSHYIQNVI